MHWEGMTKKHGNALLSLVIP